MVRHTNAELYKVGKGLSSENSTKEEEQKASDIVNMHKKNEHGK